MPNEPAANQVQNLAATLGAPSANGPDSNTPGGGIGTTSGNDQGTVATEPAITNPIQGTVAAGNTSGDDNHPGTSPTGNDPEGQEGTQANPPTVGDGNNGNNAPTTGQTGVDPNGAAPASSVAPNPAPPQTDSGDGNGDGNGGDAVPPADNGTGNVVSPSSGGDAGDSGNNANNTNVQPEGDNSGGAVTDEGSGGSAAVNDDNHSSTLPNGDNPGSQADPADGGDGDSHSNSGTEGASGKPSGGNDPEATTTAFQGGYTQFSLTLVAPGMVTATDGIKIVHIGQSAFAASQKAGQQTQGNAPNTHIANTTVQTSRQGLLPALWWLYTVGIILMLLICAGFVAKRHGASQLRKREGRMHIHGR